MKASVIFVIQAIWVAMRIMLGLGKSIAFGFSSDVSHFTNWAWAVETIFYTATLPAAFVIYGQIHPNSKLGEIVQTTIIVLFFPLVGIVFMVRLIVLVMLATRAEFLYNMFFQMDPNIVFIGDAVFHSFPIVELLVFYALNRKLVLYAHNRLSARYHLHRSAMRFIVYVIYHTFGGPLILLGMYNILFDARQVYVIDIPPTIGFIVAICSLSISLGMFTFVLILDEVVTSPQRLDLHEQVLWLSKNDARPLLRRDHSDVRINS